MKTLYRLIDDELLPAFRPGRNIRLRRSDLEAYLRSCRVQPGDLTHLYEDATGR